jgi:hypothetical protein
MRKHNILRPCCVHAHVRHKGAQDPNTDDNERQAANPPPSQPTFGALPPFAPRPQPSALSATPILNQPIDAEEPEVIRYVLEAFFNPHEVG